MTRIPPPIEALQPERSAYCQWADCCPVSGNSSRGEAVPHFPCLQKGAFNLVGIPTVEGMEFLKLKEIIRCEGLQRLTKVFTTDGTIISSYNIGEFCKMLFPFGFFSPHKSHLINLHYLRSYHIDGVINLRDGSHVPLARRRRAAFLERVRHL